MSEVLFLGCFYRCSSACINGLISPRCKVQNTYVVYMFQSLAHAETAEENNFRVVVKSRGPGNFPGY